MALLTAPRADAIPRALWIVAACAAIAGLVLAWNTHGTNDVDAFRQYADERARWGAVATYAQDPDYNHPPFVFAFLLALRWISDASGLSFGFCLRALTVAASFASTLLAANLVLAHAPARSALRSLVVVAAAPASIMIAGFHGNTDPLMVFFVLLSLTWIERPNRLWLAGVAMGMSVNFKVVPLVFCPAVFLWLGGWHRRFVFFGAAFACIALASAPVVFEAPALVARKVFLYKSDYGVWGAAWILLRMERELAPLNGFFRHFGRHVLVAVVLALSVWMNAGARKPPLVRQIGLLAFAFLSFTPGFAVQYLAWLVPWIGAVPFAAALAFALASGAFLFLVYTCWCQGLPAEIGVPSALDAAFWSRGLPWNSANANLLALWRGPIVPFGVACWVAVLAVFAVMLRTIARERGERRESAAQRP